MKKLIALTVVFAPALAFAQPLTDINSVATKATSIGTLLVSIAIGFSVVWIIISIVRFLVAGDEEKRKEGKTSFIYGIIGLFLIFSVWGIVNLLRNSFNFGQNNIDVNSEVNRLVPQNQPRVN